MLTGSGNTPTSRESLDDPPALIALKSASADTCLSAELCAGLLHHATVSGMHGRIIAVALRVL